MNENNDWIYDVKCRRCGKITRMFLSSKEQIKKEDFRKWVLEHSVFPIEKQCECDNGMLMLHDIVSFGNILSL
jgi:hypothetical protein